MKKLIALIIVLSIMSVYTVGCSGNNPNSGGISVGGSEESSSIGGLSSSSYSSYSSYSSAESASSSSSSEDEPPQPDSMTAYFDKISEKEGNIFSLTFDNQGVLPLYSDGSSPGSWSDNTPLGIYQNFSVKNGEGSPATNYVDTSDGCAELVDLSGGGTKLIFDFGDKDIDNGAIEGYFELKIIDVGINWTPVQFFGTDKKKQGSEILGIRTTSSAANGAIMAGVRIDGDSNNVNNPSVVFENGYTYAVHFDFNIDYDRAYVEIDCLEKPFNEIYAYTNENLVLSSIKGLCISTSDTDMRRCAIDNFALSAYDGRGLFNDELRAYADKFASYADGNEQILKKVEDILQEFDSLAFTQTEVPLKELLQAYRQKIYDVYASSSEIFVIDSTMTEFIDGFIDNTTSYRPNWASEGFKDRWNYIDGVFLEGLVQNYERTGNDKYKNFFINYINYYIYEQGVNLNDKFRSPRGTARYAGNELDSVCESRILFDAFGYTNDRRYVEAIDFTYDTLKLAVPMAGNSGCYSHKYTYRDQIWLDGFYMYAPFTARYAEYYGKTELFDELTSQFKYVYENMRDEKGLYRHGMDVSKYQSWADKQTGLSQSVWLRGEGWLLAALIDCIEIFPEGNNRQFLEKMFSEAMESIIVYRDAQTGMFYNVVDFDPTVILKNGDKNYLETSGSSLLSYVCQKGARLGVLSEAYSVLGAETFEGIYQNKLVRTGSGLSLKDIILSAGLGSGRNGSPEYYIGETRCENDGKGVGPFLMAYNEYMMYKNAAKA